MRLHKPFSAALLAAVLAVSAALAEEEEAERIYRDVQGCVVGLKNIEGSGTGILLDSGGLILTNAHVIASPLPFKCKVDLRRGRQFQTVTYKNVKILGVHPSKDLALVRIDPREHKGKLQTAKLAKSKSSPGKRVYAIGNPAGGGGVVLSKTITAGILSGVDRVIEKVSYYQIDAPINAGNSGGPLCDKTGQVIGLVTLKFTDVENVGFAIPLHDLNTRQFIPLAQRKGDPEQSRELIERAKKYYEMSVKARKRKGADDPEVRMYSLYSAKYYHLALANDPGNDAIYYNVGMLLRGLDADEIAAAYLLQAVELAPWGRGDADYYRELGLALVKQKKFDEARVTWEEGISKYPRKAAKIWEDRIIFFRNDQQDFYESAYAAAVVMHLADPNSRLDMAKKLHGEARDLLRASGKKKLDEAVAKIDRELRRRTVTAERARKAKKPYLTEEFAEYVQNSGTLGAHDEPVQVARVDRRPAEEETPDPDDQPQRPELDLTVPEGSFDLLRGINLSQDAVAGRWKFDGKVLVTPPTSYARLQLPARLPAEYDLTMIVEQKSNRREFVIGLVRGGVQSAFFVDSGGSVSGLDPAGRDVHRGRVFAAGRPRTIKCKIRREGLLVMVDGKRIFFERTDDPLPAVSHEWNVPDSTRLFIGSHITKYHIHKLMLTPYKRR